MANNNINPDELYQKSREFLLPYEDIRTQSLFNATADFYLTRNDQSVWGAFLRILSQELARLEFSYAYDSANKNPSYLTPPDAQRRWSDPLFVSSQYPASTQFDLDYRDMLAALITAYRKGSTVEAIQEVIYAYTGIQVIVQELYKEIGNGIFDISDTNSIKVSINVGGSDPLRNIQTLNQLQLIVNSLYGAIDLAKPAHVGLEFTTVFGTDENIDAYVINTDTWSSSTPGINDQLGITIRLIETPPFDPMLYQAPILDPSNPTTTLAAYGRKISGQYLTLSTADWNALSTINLAVTATTADGTNATYAFTPAGSVKLREGMQVSIYGCSRSAFNLTGVIKNVTDITFQMALAQTLSYSAEASAHVMVTPTLKSAYYLSGVSYIAGLANWAASTAMFQSQLLMDTNGNMQMAITAGNTDTLLPGTLYATITSVAAAVGGQTTYTGTFSPVLLAGYPVTISNCNLTENIGTFTVASCSATQLVVTNAAGRAETLVTPARAIFNPWSTTLSGEITDGTVAWRMVGQGQSYQPSYKWIMLLPQPVPGADPSIPLAPTGEVGNWDITHPIGLVAPRLNQTWEISGGDTFASFEMP